MKQPAHNVSPPELPQSAARVAYVGGSPENGVYPRQKLVEYAGDGGFPPEVDKATGERPATRHVAPEQTLRIDDYGESFDLPINPKGGPVTWSIICTDEARYFIGGEIAARLPHAKDSVEGDMSRLYPFHAADLGEMVSGEIGTTLLTLTSGEPLPGAEKPEEVWSVESRYGKGPTVERVEDKDHVSPFVFSEEVLEVAEVMLKAQPSLEDELRALGSTALVH
jgi:hypothetical protein